MSRSAREIILRPVFTEKASWLMDEGTDSKGRRLDKVRERVEARRKYTFEVAPNATKIEIRKAVESMFDVTVKSVRTVNVAGKKRRLGRSLGRRPHWKKAIVEVSEADTIDVFEGV
jgi:large subunit ribosomal protein L23